MNPDLVPELRVDKNGKAVTRNVSARKARKLGLTVPPPVIAPKLDPKVVEMRALRADLIKMHKTSVSRLMSVSEWNRDIHALGDEAVRAVAAACNGDEKRENRVIGIVDVSSDDQTITDAMCVLPLFEDEEYDRYFIIDVVEAIRDYKVFPTETVFSRLNAEDNAYFEAIVKVSIAMHASGPNGHDRHNTTVTDPDLRDLLREKPEAVEQIAFLAKERGPSLTGALAREYLAMEAKALHDGLL